MTCVGRPWAISNPGHVDHHHAGHVGRGSGPRADDAPSAAVDRAPLQEVQVDGFPEGAIVTPAIAPALESVPGHAAGIGPSMLPQRTDRSTLPIYLTR
jgi:hypothetical protein